MRVLVANEQDKLSVFSVSRVKIGASDFSGLKDARSITVADAGLTSVKIPASTALTQLNLSGNELTELDLSKYPNLYFIALNDNKFTTFDLSKAKKLGLALLAGNNMKEITIDNPDLWNLDLSKNAFRSTMRLLWSSFG